MNALQEFKFNQSNVRVVIIKNEPWWVAKDVCEILGYTWSGNSRVEHVPEEWRGVTSVVTPSGNQDMIILSEQGLYFFLNRSDKKAALPFQKWIAGEVLPQIRKTGSYGLQIPQNQNQQILLLCQKLTEQTTALIAAETKLIEQQPKVALAEACIVSDGLKPLTDVSKVLKVHPRLFEDHLKEIGALYKRKGLTPKDPYIENGCFEVKKIVFTKKDGTPGSKDQTYVTGKGLSILKIIADKLPVDSRIRNKCNRKEAA